MTLSALTGFSSRFCARSCCFFLLRISSSTMVIIATLAIYLLAAREFFEQYRNAPIQPSTIKTFCATGESTCAFSIGVVVGLMVVSVPPALPPWSTKEGPNEPENAAAEATVIVTNAVEAVGVDKLVVRTAFENPEVSPKEPMDDNGRGKTVVKTGRGKLELPPNLVVTSAGEVGLILDS